MMNKQTFKDEALTGIKEKQQHGYKVTVQSELKRAVLYSVQKPVNNADPELLLIQIEQARQEVERVRRALHLSSEEFYRLLENGQIGYCGDHIGIFDKGADKCRACTAKKQ